MALSAPARIFGTAIGFVAAIASAGLAKEIKLADFQPTTHFVIEEVYKPMSESIDQATNGEVTIRVFSGGQLGAGAADQYQRALDGVTDIAFGLPGYTASQFPITLLSELPGVVDAETGTDRIMKHVDLLSDEYRRVKLLALWTNAPNLLLTAGNPVRTMDDLKGLQIRVPSYNAGAVVQSWGAVPVSMPAPEIYNAMQTGVIDGALIDATALQAFKLAEVTKFITTGMETTTSSFFLVMNRDAFGELSLTAQFALESAGVEAAGDGHAAWSTHATNALADFAARDGKEVITLSPEEAKPFDDASAKAVKQILDEADASGLNASAYVAALAAE